MESPIQKAIAELDNMRLSDAQSFTAVKNITTMLHNLLPYEAAKDRKIAEKAWDAAKKYTFENVSIEHDYVRDMDFIEIDYSSIEKDKQTYLNQNHPL